jgi:hypothetical protein
MHPVVVDKPYKHYPPYQGRVWPWLLQQTVRRKLRIDIDDPEVGCGRGCCSRLFVAS